MRAAVALHPTDYGYNDLSAKQIGTYGLAFALVPPLPGANTSVTGGYVYLHKQVYNPSAYRQALTLQYDVNVLSKEYLKLPRTASTSGTA